MKRRMLIIADTATRMSSAIFAAQSWAHVSPILDTLVVSGHLKDCSGHRPKAPRAFTEQQHDLVLQGPFHPSNRVRQIA